MIIFRFWTSKYLDINKVSVTARAAFLSEHGGGLLYEALGIGRRIQLNIQRIWSRACGERL